MSEDCVRQLLRDMRDRLDDIFMGFYRVDMGTNIFFSTLLLLNYLLRSCKPLRRTEGLNFIALNCKNRLVNVYINIESLEYGFDGKSPAEYPLTQELYYSFKKLVEKIPTGFSQEEMRLHERLRSEHDTFQITDREAIGTLSISSIQYRAPLITRRMGRYELFDPSIKFGAMGTRRAPPPLMKWVWDVELQLFVFDSQINETYMYNAHLERRGTEEVFTDSAPFSPGEVVKLGRKGVCLIRDKLLDEFNNFIDILKQTLGLSVLYLLY